MQYDQNATGSLVKGLPMMNRRLRVLKAGPITRCVYITFFTQKLQIVTL